MKNAAIRFKWQMYLIGIGLLFISLLDVVLQMPSQDFIFPDSTSYVEAARQLYYSFTPHVYRPMLIAAINGFPLLFGFSEAIFEWVFLVNSGCWLLVILMLFEILKSFLPEKKAFVFTLLYVFCPGVAILNFHLLAESVFVFFLFLAFFCFWNYFKGNRFVWLSTGLAALILSLLVKPASTILIVFALVYFAGVLFKNRNKRAAIFIYASIGLVVLQMVLMQRQYGNFTVSYIDSYTYYNYIGSSSACLENADGHCKLERRDRFLKLSQPAQKEAAAKDFQAQLRGNFLNFLKAYGRNVAGNSLRGSDAIGITANKNHQDFFENGKNILKWISTIQNMILTFCGMLLAGFYFFKENRGDVFFAAVSIVILYIVGISGVSSFQGDRFHVIIYPFAILLIAKFWSDKRKKIAD